MFNAFVNDICDILSWLSGVDWHAFFKTELGFKGTLIAIGFIIHWAIGGSWLGGGGDGVSLGGDGGDGCD